MNSLSNRPTFTLVQMRAEDLQVGDVIRWPAPATIQGFRWYEVTGTRTVGDKVALAMSGDLGPVKGEATMERYRLFETQVLA